MDRRPDARVPLVTLGPAQALVRPPEGRGPGVAREQVAEPLPQQRQEEAGPNHPRHVARVRHVQPQGCEWQG